MANSASRSRPTAGRVVLPRVPADVVEHGEVFTRPWVVDLILDLAGYTSDRDLSAFKVVEPACGGGAFLGAITRRLSDSLRRTGGDLADVADAVRAYDLLPHNVAEARRLVAAILSEDGWDASEARRVADKWATERDYLLGEPDSNVDFVLGNPPYIRLEDVPDERSSAYRDACKTMGGRADIYVGFIEMGLSSLREGGVLGFIVADRWMRNQYGRHLRQFVAENYSVDVTIQMHDVDAFEESVSAYPAISIIRRGAQGKAVVANTTRDFGAVEAKKLTAWARRPRAKQLIRKSFEVDRLPHWFPGDDLWPTGSPVVLNMIEQLNDGYDPIQNASTGTRVGIGIATGADAVYVTRDPAIVEQGRLLPLSMAADTNSGKLEWSGHYLVNPWLPDGSLVDLPSWPRLAAYFQANSKVLLRRNVAERQARDWYRTIDKVTPALMDRPKLLFPDMRMTSRPVHDPGGLYPHHNLYYVVSDDWDLRVLGGLLFSRIAEATISAYCVKMRGGTLRFQAQYLRRVRVPDPANIGTRDARALAKAFDARDPEAATKAALRVYELDESVRTWLTQTRL